MPVTAAALLIVLVASAGAAGTAAIVHQSPLSGFTFAIAGDFSRGAHAIAVSSLWNQTQPTLSIGLGDYSYLNTPPSNWCTGIWNVAVGNRNGFLTIGDHDTYYTDRLTNDQSFGYWENSTGYANACGLKGSGVSWTGSGVLSNNHTCNTSIVLSVFDTCFGREMYVDYPAASPLVRFIVLCDGVPSHPNATAWCNYGSTGTDASNHFTWLDNTVAQARNAGIPWVIVLNHDHDFAAGPYGISYSNNLWNHLITDKVDIFITAEEHNYQRSYPLLCPAKNQDAYQNNNSTIVDACIGDKSKNSYAHGEGLLYLITGTGGQALNKFNTTEANWVDNHGYFAALNDSSWGFNMFDVTQTTISDNFLSAAGNFSDAWSISYPSTVGGAVVGIDKLAIAAPYLTASLLIVAGIVFFYHQSKRRTIRETSSDSETDASTVV